MSYKNWNEIDKKHKELVLYLLLDYNLLRESLMGKDVGIIPLEEEEEEIAEDDEVVEDEEIVKTRKRKYK